MSLPEHLLVNDQDLEVIGSNKLRPMKYPNKILDPSFYFIDPSRGGPANRAFIATPKFDGNRLLIFRGKPYTSSMPKQPRNYQLFYLLDRLCDMSRHYGLVFDGELYDVDQTHHAVTSGLINAHNKELPKSMRYILFDMIPEYDFIKGKVPSFHARYSSLCRFIKDNSILLPGIEEVSTNKVSNPEEAVNIFQSYLAAGYEGAIIRHIDSGYKHGRLTPNQRWGFKLKEYVTLDGVITSVIQRRKMKTDIDRRIDVFGFYEKVHSNVAYEPDNAVGAFEVEINDEGDYHGQRCRVGFGEGFDMEERRHMWSNKASLLGRTIEFSHMPHGSKDVPRIGRLIRFKD